MHASRFHGLGLLFFGLAWLSYDHYRPWVNFHAEALAIAGVLLLTVGCLRSRGDTLNMPAVGLWIAAAALWPWVQYLAGISWYAGDALLSSLYLSALAGSVLVGHRLASAAGPFGPQRNPMHVLWIAALLSAAIGLVQWLTLQGPLGMYVVQTDPGDRAMGNLGQPNQLATLLLMGVVALAFVHEARLIGRFAFGLSAAFLSAVVVLAESRTSLVSAMVVGAFLFWKAGSLTRLRRTHILVWLACFFAGVVVLPHLANLLLLGSGRMTPLTDSAGRWVMWQQVWAGILEAPWLGYGWNQTPTAHMAGAMHVSGTMTFTHAHNLVLDLLAWNGLPLGLAVVIAGAYWFVSRMWRLQRADGVLAMACLLPLAVHSMFEYPFAYAYFLVAGGLLAGIVEAAIPGGRTFAFRKRWAWGAVVVWAVLGSYLCYEYLRIEEDFRVVRFENLNIGHTPAAYEVPDVWMISHMADMLKAARMTPTPGMAPAELERLHRVSQRFAFGALALRHAIALGLNGDPEGATRQMRLIKGMYGEFYYAAAQAVVRDLQRDRYPQLEAVRMP